MTKNWLKDWWVVGVVCVALGSALTLTVAVAVIPEAPSPATAQTKPAVVKKTPSTPRSVDGLEGVETVVGGKTYFKVTRFNPAKKSGTLTFIATQYDTTVPQLVRWNHISDPDVIHVGQKLRVR